MRTLRELKEASATEAIDLFVYRIVREIGSMAAAAGGVDAIVFTGGIGQNDPLVRERVAAASGSLGLTLDPRLNDDNQIRIDSEGSEVAAFVIPTDEEQMIQPIGGDPQKNFSAESYEVYGAGAFLLAGSEVIKLK